MTKNWTCKKCGKLNEADARRCTCGRFLDDASEKRAAEYQKGPVANHGDVVGRSVQENVEVLQMTEDAIKKQLGTLNDLPRELANTIANVYYRYFEFSLNAIGALSRPGGLPKHVHQLGLQEGMKAFVGDHARFTTDVDHVAEQIENLRQVDKRTQPNMYRFIVHLMLEVYKYDIDNAWDKTGLRRMVERKIKAKQVKEVPNLIDLLKV
jgi:hypothetical protein